jgi:hypothetical protein
LILINHFKPCLNVRGKNYSNPLPKRYEIKKVANQGVKLDE